MDSQRMKKRIFLMFLLILAGMACRVEGAVDVGSYTPASAFEYTINEGAVTITKFIGDQTAVFIPPTIEGKPVTTIGGYAFSYCNEVTSVVIPNGVTTISYSVFNKCYSLESVIIPDSVTTIGNCAFDYCESLVSIMIPDGITKINDYTFEYCYSLRNVQLPESLTEIGWNAFYGCSSLESITIPRNVAVIGMRAFEKCYGLTEILILSNFVDINYGAFRECENLKTIKVLEDNEGYCVVDGILFSKDKTKLLWYPAGREDTEFIIPTGVNEIGGRAFMECVNLKHITIPDTVNTIGIGAFEYCENLASIVIPSSVTSIGNGAFSNCYSLESIGISNRVTSIGATTFEYCRKLASITIPANVKTIGSYAFRGSNNLSKIIFMGNPPTFENASYSVPITFVVPRSTEWENWTVPSGVTVVYGIFSQNLELKPGWNLVTLTRPLDSMSSNVQKFLSLKPIRYDVISRTYVFCERAENVKAGGGYWIFSKTKQTVELALDVSQTAAEPSLKKGWNLVGMTDGATWSDSATAIWGWEDGSFKLLEKKDLKIGNAYWILMP